VPTTFIAQPQRSDGLAFIPCPQNCATSFAVIRVDKTTRLGKATTSMRVIGRYSTKTQAEGMAAANNKSFTPEPRHLVRKLGRRITKPCATL